MFEKERTKTCLKRTCRECPLVSVVSSHADDPCWLHSKEDKEPRALHGKYLLTQLRLVSVTWPRRALHGNCHEYGGLSIQYHPHISSDRDLSRKKNTSFAGPPLTTRHRVRQSNFTRRSEEGMKRHPSS